MADKKPTGGYVVPPVEYERTGPAPEDPFTDPQEIEEVLEEIRDRGTSRA